MPLYSFPVAMQRLLIAGFRIKRRRWTRQHIEMRPITELSKDCVKYHLFSKGESQVYIAVVRDDTHTVRAWSARQSDLLAQDWQALSSEQKAEEL